MSKGKEAEIQPQPPKRHIERVRGKLCCVERPQPSSQPRRLKKEGVLSPIWSIPMALLKQNCSVYTIRYTSLLVSRGTPWRSPLGAERCS